MSYQWIVMLSLIHDQHSKIMGQFTEGSVNNCQYVANFTKQWYCVQCGGWNLPWSGHVTQVYPHGFQYIMCKPKFFRQTAWGAYQICNCIMNCWVNFCELACCQNRTLHFCAKDVEACLCSVHSVNVVLLLMLTENFHQLLLQTWENTNLWSVHFKSGHNLVGHFEHSGCSLSSWSDENVEKVHEIISEGSTWWL
jgi:hypothetical protein